MPSPYSYDLRAKAINAVESGARKTDVCRFLKISRNTLDLWLKKQEETGDFQAQARPRAGRSQKIKDEAKFRQFVQQHSGKTQQQIAQLWGENLTQQNVSDAMKRFNITRKKNLWVSREE